MITAACSPAALQFRSTHPNLRVSWLEIMSGVSMAAPFLGFGESAGSDDGFFVGSFGASLVDEDDELCGLAPQQMVVKTPLFLTRVCGGS